MSSSRAWHSPMGRPIIQLQLFADIKDDDEVSTPELTIIETPPSRNASPLTPFDLAKSPTGEYDSILQGSPLAIKRKGAKTALESDSKLSLYEARTFDRAYRQTGEPGGPIPYKIYQTVPETLDVLTEPYSEWLLNHRPIYGNRMIDFTFSRTLNKIKRTAKHACHLNKSTSDHAAISSVIVDVATSPSKHVKQETCDDDPGTLPLDQPQAQAELNHDTFIRAALIEEIPINLEAAKSRCEDIVDEGSLQVTPALQQILKIPTNQNRVLRSIMPYNVMERLHYYPGQCVSSTVRNPNSRCQNKSQWNDKDTSWLRDMLLQADEAFDFVTATPLIQSVRAKAMCRRHHRTIATELLNTLLLMVAGDSYIKATRSTKGTSQYCLLPADLDDVPQWLHAFKTLPPWVGGASTTTYKTSQSPNEIRPGFSYVSGHNSLTNSIKLPVIEIPVAQPAKRVPSVKPSPFDTRAVARQCTALKQNFQAYHSLQQLQALSVGDAIRKKIYEPLGWRDEFRQGSIYIYWHLGNFGYLKIGVTTRSPQERLKEWHHSCGHDIQLLSTQGKEDTKIYRARQVPHVYRVESLIHTELRNYRQKEFKCSGCKRNHGEWFQVPFDIANKVVEKWTTWVSDSNPYEPRGTAMSVIASNETTNPRNKATVSQYVASLPGGKSNRVKMVKHEGVLVPALSLAQTVTEDMIKALCMVSDLDEQRDSLPFPPTDRSRRLAIRRLPYAHSSQRPRL